MNVQNLSKRILLICLFFSSLLTQCFFSYESTTRTTTTRTRKREPKGFFAGTLVKTPQGYRPIETLKIGDEVVCFDNQSKCTTSKIINTYVVAEPTLAILQVGTETLCCHPMQKFCCLDKQKKLRWAPAHDLEGLSILSCKTGYYQSISCNHLYLNIIENHSKDPTFKCHGISVGSLTDNNVKKNFIYPGGNMPDRVTGNQTFYDLEIENYHNFCVTKNDIVVHNVAFEFVLTYVFEEGFKWTIGLLFAWMGVNWLSGEGKKRTESSQIIDDSPGLNSYFNADAFGQRFKSNANNEQQQSNGSGEKPNEGQGPGESAGGEKEKPGKNDGGKKPEEDKSEKAKKAPGKPTKEDGFEPPKNSDGEKKPHPKTGQHGWEDNKGNVWVPDKSGHGGPHWDRVSKDGKSYDNVYPGGKVRPGR